MERHALILLCLLLLCATVCTAYGASTTSFLDALLAHQGGSSAASAASTAQAKPLIYKGKRYGKYVAKLRPTKLNGKLVGDAGASGAISVKAV
ncbi:unnamed protein product, partial [Closterium sp. Naga37s-1]